MKHCYKNTYTLKDGTIVVFYENGFTEVFGSKNWKNTKGFGMHQFNFDSKEQAKKIFIEIEKLF